jgi:hypothetical protein
VLYPEQDEQTAGETDGETADVNKGMNFILSEVSPDRFTENQLHEEGFDEFKKK